MLHESLAFSGFSVDDLDQAKSFYTGTLGLEASDIPESDGLMMTLHLAGDRDVLVYVKSDHEPASYTILNFPVDDIESTVDQLSERGVAFERYEGFGAFDDRGIFRGGGPAIAWFTDPAGNVLSVLEQT